MPTFIPLLQLLLVEMCGFLQVDELLLRQLALAASAMDGQRVPHHIQMRDSSALGHLVFKVLYADLEGASLLLLELGIALGDMTGNVEGAWTSVMAQVCNAGASFLGRRVVGQFVAVGFDVVHFLPVPRRVGHCDCTEERGVALVVRLSTRYKSLRWW